ncbi:MAG: type II toxin-antitoxin system RelE/ParE family toxin [Terriglobales bacterium]
MPAERFVVLWRKRALAILEAEAEYIARDHPAAARSMVSATKQHARRLSEYPALSRPGPVPGTRELVVPATPYVPPYRVRAGRLEILRVLHAARKWPPRL